MLLTIIATKETLDQTWVNSNSTITPSVSYMSFKRDYFTVISFDTLKMKRKRHKYIVCRKREETWTHYEWKKCNYLLTHTFRIISYLVRLSDILWNEAIVKVIVKFSVCTINNAEYKGVNNIGLMQCSSMFWLFQYTFWEMHADGKFLSYDWIFCYVRHVSKSVVAEGLKQLRREKGKQRGISN